MLSISAPIEQVVKTPPLLCIEVLSPDDTMRRTMVRVRDFLDMGVPEVWIFNTEQRSVHVCTEESVSEHHQGSLPVPQTPIFLSIAEAFSILDRKRRTV